MKIRRATYKDVKDIVDIEWQSGYKWNNNYKECLKLVEKIFREGYCEVYIMENSKDKIGYTGISFDVKKKICYINYMAVKKKYQGKGMAKLLKQKQIAEAKKKKMKYLETTVWAKNFPMIALNTKQGFYVTDIKRRYYKNGDDKIRMRKNLD